MNMPFHYYGTFCAAKEAGATEDMAQKIADSAQFVDDCSRTLLNKYKLTNATPTVHTMTELLNMNRGLFGVELPDEIPQVWTSFHFLPGNLNEDLTTKRIKYGNPEYCTSQKVIELFNLLCLPYSYTVGEIVKAAKNAYNNKDYSEQKKLCYVGMVMHVLADTFAHEYFVGAACKYINEVSWVTLFDVDTYISPYNLSNIQVCDSTNKPFYLYSPGFSSTSVGWLGHGRAGSYPDIPNVKYYYNPKWNPYAKCIKENPLTHLCAFFQMKNAMKYIFDDTNEITFDYAKELTRREYFSDLGQNVLKIFASGGDDETQKRAWIYCITQDLNLHILDYNVDRLALTENFLTDFTDNADRHRKMVCEYCKSVTKNITYYNYA